MSTAPSVAKQSNIEQILTTIVNHVDEDIRDAARAVSKLLRTNRDSHLTVDGKLHSEIEDALSGFPMEKEQAVQLSKVIPLLIQAERVNNLAEAYNDKSIKIAESTIAGLRSQGLNTEQIVDHLKLVAFDSVLTMHPTFVGTLEYARHMHEFDTAIEQGNFETLGKITQRVLSSPTVVEGRRTSEEETAIMVHYLTNIYDAIPKLYGEFDTAFIKQGITGYDKKELNLDITLRSWGSSGDKDGNSNINYQTTLDAVTEHRQAIASLYLRDLSELGRKSKTLQDSPHYAEIRRNLEEIQRLDPNINNVEFITGTTRMMQTTLNDVFDRAEKGSEEQALALGLMRKLQTFGMSIGKIEYRETADEHAHVLDNILVNLAGKKPYSAMKDAEKEKIVDDLLADPDCKHKMQDLIQTAMKNVPEEAKGRENVYQNDDENGYKGIFYNTIKRLELAAANPDMIQGQVLAEAETPLQVKEMLLLLKATGNDRNVRIVPLYEKPSVLKEAGNITRTMLNDPEYFSYLVETSLREWDEKAGKGINKPLDELTQDNIRTLNPQDIDFKQRLSDINTTLMAEHGVTLSDVLKIQTMIAHSDNTRRSGITGAKGGIYEAHIRINQVAEEFGFGTVYHEGGSHTDSLRMGVRRESGQIDTYGVYEYVKSTVQGIDNFMMNNSVFAVGNRLKETLCHCASRIGVDRDDEGHRIMGGTSLEAALTRHVHRFDYVLGALVDQVDNYKDKFFNDQRFGTVLAQVLGYSQNKEDGNVGLRAAGRKGSKDTTRFIDPISGTRTIGFSETGQHKNSNFGFLGAGALQQSLVEKFNERTESHQPHTIGGRILHQETRSIKEDAEKVQYMYRKSPAVRSAIDPVAYGAAATNFDEIWRRAMLNNNGTKRVIEIVDPKERSKVLAEEQISQRPSPDQLPEMAKRNNVAGFLAKAEIEYRKAAKLSYAALTGKELDMDSSIPTIKLMEMIRQNLPEHAQKLAQSDVVIALTDYLENLVGTENSRLLHHARASSIMVPPKSKAEMIHLGLAENKTLAATNGR